jgi:hypothetical protein
MTMSDEFQSTAIEVWNRDTQSWSKVEISTLCDEVLVDKYAAEAESSDRRISSDPPSPEGKLRDEILRRMKR